MTCKDASIYNENNIFYKIISKVIPASIVKESKYSLVIEDINPQAPKHYLLMPKGNYVDINHFLREASNIEKEDLFHLLEKFTTSKNGSKVIINTGKFGKQEVLHFHIHILFS